MSDTLVIDISLMRKGEFGHLIGDFEAIFSSLDAEGLVSLILVYIVATKKFGWEHTLHLSLRKNSISSNVLKSVITKPITIDGLYDSSILIRVESMFHNRRFWGSRIISFREFGDIVFSLQIGLFHLISF